MPNLIRGTSASTRAARLRQQSQAGMRTHVETFADAIVAGGGVPLLNQDDQRILRYGWGNPAMIAVTLTDNAAVAETLKDGASWDVTAQGLFSSTSSDLEACFHLEGYFLYINDSDYRGETQALKESLDNNAYINTVRDGKTLNLPLRGAINEPWKALDFKQATAANEERALHAGGAIVLPRPLRLDLKVDTMQLVCSAINWASGNILAYVGLVGSLAPRELLGAGGVKDAALPAGVWDEDIGGAPTGLPPLLFADLAAQVAQRNANVRALAGGWPR